MRRLTIMLASVLVAGCASRQAKGPGYSATTVSCSSTVPFASTINGARSDVHVQIGAHHGFVVKDKCREPNCLGVRGTGANFFPGLRPWDRPLSTENADKWRAVVMGALAGLSSVHLSGFGAACNDPGLFVWLDDWREVDAALERIGAMLERDNLQETVGVCVMTRIHSVELAAPRK